MRKIIEAVEDRWETLPKEKFSEKQRKFFFAVGAMRDSKEGDGKVEMNYSKIPKRKKSNESTVNEKVYTVEPHKGGYAVCRWGKVLYTYDPNEFHEAEQEAEELEDEYEKGYDVTFILLHKSGKDGDGSSVKTENVKAFSEKEAIDYIYNSYKRAYKVMDIKARKVE